MHTARGCTTAFTIVAKNYLPFARTLMSSVAREHPQWRRVVILCDEVDDAFDPTAESFELIRAAELGIRDFEEMVFRYSILELSTAVKPSAFRRLFQDGGCDRIIYLDPDTYVYRPLTAVERTLDEGALMVLTPHLTGPLNDHSRPSEVDILRSGTFNLGFLALAWKRETADFLCWWEKHLADQCVVDLDAGLFVDQKWMDLAPGLFADVAILRHPGYNLAYWNLAHRPVVSDGAGGVTVLSEPLVFAHFSGVDPANPSGLSKHQDRFCLADTGAFQMVVEDYCRRVRANGFEECRRWPYHYDYGPGDVRINEYVRQLYRNDSGIQREARDDPYRVMPRLANQPANSRHPGVSRLMMQIWTARRDLQSAFPQPFGEHKPDFINWFVHESAREGLDLDPYFYESAKHWEAAPPDTLIVTGGLVRLLFQLKRLVPSKRLRRFIRLLLVGRHPRDSVPVPEPPPVKLEPTRVKPTVLGANLVGYSRAETGVGESVRMAIRSLSSTDVPFSMVRYGDEGGSRHGNARFADLEATYTPYFANVWHINADQVPVAFDQLGRSFSRDCLNIGVWHWELPDLLPAWHKAVDLLDEFWAPSRFVQSMLRKLTDKPVLHMPHGLRIELQLTWSRSDFGLPSRPFLFLCMFDVLSVTARKNPKGAVAAFREAMGERDDVALVVKVNHAEQPDDEYRGFRAEVANMPNIILLEQGMSREMVHGLVSVCDSFLSLHRSEGFGLGPFEAMSLGKPVICTDWSGTTDFVSEETGMPVRYNLVTLDRQQGPYPRGATWAEPDLEHAAWCIRRMVDESGLAQRLGQQAQLRIALDFSPDVAGRRMADRLRQLHIDRFGATLRSEPPTVSARVRERVASGSVGLKRHGSPGSTTRWRSRS